MIFMKILRNFVNIKQIKIGSKIHKYQYSLGINVASDDTIYKKKKSGNCMVVTE